MCKSNTLLLHIRKKQSIIFHKIYTFMSFFSHKKAVFFIKPQYNKTPRIPPYCRKRRGKNERRFHMKKSVFRLYGVFASLFLSLAVTACQSKPDDPDGAAPQDQHTFPSLDAKDTDTDFSESDACVITLNRTSAELSGKGASADGSKITLSSAGNYIVKGTLDDGQLIVDVKSGDVRIILDDARISCSYSCPLYVANADKVIITLAGENGSFLEDSSSYDSAYTLNQEANAVIYSKDDLTINGSGALKVSANFNNGITCNDDLIIAGGKISISAADNGVKAKNSLRIADGALDITSDGDGIQSGGDLLMERGSISVVSGGGSENGRLHYDGMGGWDFSYGQDDSESTASIKGIKAVSDIRIDGGSLSLDCADDAIHANGSIHIGGGSFDISSGDDAIHADSSITIYDGKININDSYEGIEAASITINGGQTALFASDDGLNASGSGLSAADISISINGGTLFISASGDGIDSNGSVTMNGGTVIVDGPSNNGNGALDYETAFYMNGGYLAAAGSSGMACNVSSESKQYGALIAVNADSAKETVTLADSDGNVLISFTPAKSWNALNFSTPDMKTGETYFIYSGGTLTDSDELCSGCFTGGKISGGTELASFTQSETAYSSNGMGGMHGGPGGFGGGHGGGFDGKPGGRPDEGFPGEPPSGFAPDGKPET